MAKLDFFHFIRISLRFPLSAARIPLGSEQSGVIRLLADWFSQLGFQCEVTALPDLPGKFNLVATYGQGKAAAAGGHTDTVPFDEGAWTKDPSR